MKDAIEQVGVEKVTLKERATKLREEANSGVMPKSERAPRPGKRRFGSQQGPLGWLEGLHIEGYYLYFCNDKMPNDPFYIQKLLDPTVGYEYVHPSEVGLDSVEGFNFTDKVCMPVGHGITGYLLKQPLEWHLEDMKKENEPTKKQLFDSLLNAKSQTKLSRI